MKRFKAKSICVTARSPGQAKILAKFAKTSWYTPLEQAYHGCLAAAQLAQLYERFQRSKEVVRFSSDSEQLFALGGLLEGKGLRTIKGLRNKLWNMHLQALIKYRQDVEGERQIQRAEVRSEGRNRFEGGIKPSQQKESQTKLLQMMEEDNKRLISQLKNSKISCQIFRTFYLNSKYNAAGPDEDSKTVERLVQAANEAALLRQNSELKKMLADLVDNKTTVASLTAPKTERLSFRTKKPTDYLRKQEMQVTQYVQRTMGQKGLSQKAIAAALQQKSQEMKEDRQYSDRVTQLFRQQNLGSKLQELFSKEQKRSASREKTVKQLFSFMTEENLKKEENVTRLSGMVVLLQDELSRAIRRLEETRLKLRDAFAIIDRLNQTKEKQGLAEEGLQAKVQEKARLEAEIGAISDLRNENYFLNDKISELGRTVAKRQSQLKLLRVQVSTFQQFVRGNYSSVVHELDADKLLDEIRREEKKMDIDLEKGYSELSKLAEDEPFKGVFFQKISYVKYSYRKAIDRLLHRIEELTTHIVCFAADKQHTQKALQTQATLLLKTSLKVEGTLKTYVGQTRGYECVVCRQQQRVAEGLREGLRDIGELIAGSRKLEEGEEIERKFKQFYKGLKGAC